MFTTPHWNVFVIDDEPDVHTISELALKGQTFFGLKARLHHANSARHAREMLAENEELRMTVGVCLVDVVMETSDAGLLLCKDLRAANATTRIVLRTGQPGMAPPRQVIDDNDVSGYISKAEATADILYITLKTNLQAVFHIRQHMRSALAWNAVANEAKTPAEVPDAFFKALHQFAKHHTLNAAFDFGDKYYGFGYYADRNTYEKGKSDLLKGAADQLAKTTTHLGTPNPCAIVGDDLVIETAVPGHSQRARLVLRSPTLPRGLFSHYALAWRHDLLGLAEAVWFGKK